MWTSMSDITAPIGSTQTNSLGQSLGHQGDTHGVTACIGEFAQSIKKAKSLQRRGIETDAHRWVALFYPVKARATGEGALRHDCRR
jgi:hypothetical protein